MQWRWEWNPVTVKRWRRFQQMKRASWSLRILASLYAVSLLAECICGETPLYIRFQGKSFFPLVRYYPESAFVAGGKGTRPDYKQLRQSPLFSAGSGNWMIFPPVPYGPFEILNPADIRLPDSLRLSLRPRPRVASVNLRPDGAIERATQAGFFFDRPDTEVPGLSFTNFWASGAELSDAMRTRFRNEAAPAVSVRAQSLLHPSRTADLTLSPYEPRSSPPTSVRLTLRERMDAAAGAGFLELDANLAPVRVRVDRWNRLAPEDRSNLLAFASQSLSGGTQTTTLELDGLSFEVQAERPEVRWPFPPVRGHWLGVDNAGRDVLARILHGLRTSMTFGLLLVLLSMTLGTVLGAIQGYFGGGTDIVGQRLTELWSALPFLYVMILLGAVYGRGFALLLFCYAIFNWIGISYYMRAEFLRLRHMPFVEAARATGLPHRKILFRHMLPNALTPLVTFFPFQLVGAIGALAALDYLGFGLPPPTASWGELLQQAHQFRWAWWLILYPSLALFSVMLLGVFVGEGIRNAYDPRPFSRFE